MCSGWRRESRRVNKRLFVNCLFACLLLHEIFAVTNISSSSRIG